MEFKYEIGDCRELLKQVPDESVKLVVTSPPYNIGKPYGKYRDKIALNDWQELINEVTKEIYRILTPDGSFFLNLSPVPLGEGKEIIPLPFLGYQIMKDNNFYLRNMITWTFNNMQNCTNRLSGRYENILWGVKDIDNYVFNLDDIRVPYITKNDKRLEGGIGRNPTDVWYFDRVNNMTKKKLDLSHPTVYPLSMIVRILKMSSNPGDTILDPFAGSGTSLVAAKILDRNAIGFELDSKYKSEAYRRIETEGNMEKSVFDELYEDNEKSERYKRAQEDVIRYTDELKTFFDKALKALYPQNYDDFESEGMGEVISLVKELTYDQVLEMFPDLWDIGYESWSSYYICLEGNNQEILNIGLYRESKDDDWATHSIEYFIGGDLAHNEGGEMVDCISFTLSKENRSKTN